MKIIVYSVNTGGYDNFMTPSIIDPNVQYILFTDNKYFKSKVWEVNHVDFISNIKDSRRISRYIKTNSHLVLPTHDISIWIDHCYNPKVNDFSRMLKENNFGDIMSYKHNVRNCIYDESITIINDKLDYPELVKKQMEKYKTEGYPKNHGLFDSGFTVRKNNDKVKLFNETWWNEILNGSARDQLSQVYSSWKTKIPINSFIHGNNIYNNPYLNEQIKHPKRWTI